MTSRRDVARLHRDCTSLATDQKVGDSSSSRRTVERPIADEWLGIRTPTVKGRGFCVRGLNSVRVAERVDANIGILRRERDIAASFAGIS